MESLEVLKRNMVEVVTEEDAASLNLRQAKAYQGFEPSGIPHLGTGVLWPMKINELVSLGVSCTILLADWHAYVNNKLGGDIEKIRRSGHVFESGMRAMGLSDRVKFIWASDIIDSGEYFTTLIKMAKQSSLPRLKRALPIMGRVEDDAEKDFSMFIYPMMQVTDIAIMDVDIALGAMDQRHAHMLQRDIAEKAGYKKVVAIHGPLLSSLKGPGRMDSNGNGDSTTKMSKSDPGSAIFIFDSEEDIQNKLNKAFCPLGEIKQNPVLDIAKYILFPYSGEPLDIERPAKSGGAIMFHDYEDLEIEYEKKNIHPADLKSAVSAQLAKLLRPARSVARNLDPDLELLGYKTSGIS